MRTGKKDLWGEEILISDIVRLGPNKYKVRYGNYTAYGIQRIGVYLEPESKNIQDISPGANIGTDGTEVVLKAPLLQTDLIPFEQAKTLVKVKE